MHCKVVIYTRTRTDVHTSPLHTKSCLTYWRQRDNKPLPHRIKSLTTSDIKQSNQFSPLSLLVRKFCTDRSSTASFFGAFSEFSTISALNNKQKMSLVVLGPIRFPAVSINYCRIDPSPSVHCISAKNQ